MTGFPCFPLQSNSQSQTVVVENPMSVDESGKLVRICIKELPPILLGDSIPF